MNNQRKALRLTTKKAFAGLLFSLPFLVGFLLFYLTPLIRSLYFSFFNLGISVNGMVLSPAGLDNFRYIFAVDPYYVKTIVESMKSLSTTLPVIVLYSFFIAIVLNQKFKGRTLARILFFLPIVLNSGVVQMNMNDMFLQGVNQQLTGMGVEKANDTLDLTGTILAMLPYQDTRIVDFVSSIVAQIGNITMNSGVQILIFIAGLQTIPASLYEASSMEGANGWENFWKITLPVMSPLILVNCVYTIIDQMTGASNPVIRYTRGLAFGGANFGLASAMSWVYLPLIFIVLLVVIAIISRFTFYEN
jgi:ABC-type sugar transport system permease subunit